MTSYEHRCGRGITSNLHLGNFVSITKIRRKACDRDELICRKYRNRRNDSFVKLRPIARQFDRRRGTMHTTVASEKTYKYRKMQTTRATIAHGKIGPDRTNGKSTTGQSPWLDYSKWPDCDACGDRAWQFAGTVGWPLG